MARQYNENSRAQSHSVTHSQHNETINRHSSHKCTTASERSQPFSPSISSLSVSQQQRSLATYDGISTHTRAEKRSVIV